MEIVAALDDAAPDHPALPAIIALWQQHAAGMAAMQDAGDGRWHQILNDTSTFLETSATAMMLYSLIEGVRRGHLDGPTFAPVITRAWAGLSSTVTADGTVLGICSGTPVGMNATFYNDRPTAYNTSDPGLGSVFRAALAYSEYLEEEGGF